MLKKVDVLILVFTITCATNAWLIPGFTLRSRAYYSAIALLFLWAFCQGPRGLPRDFTVWYRRGMKTPSIFKPLDLLSMVLPCLLSIIAVVLTFVYPASTEARALVVTVAACFIVISARTLQLRYAFIASYPVRLSCNVCVRLNGYKGTEDDLNWEVTKVVSMYKAHFADAAALLARAPVWVEFVPELITLGTRAVAGYVSGDTVKVSYYRRLADGDVVTWPEAPIDHTAFAHELAHIIIGRATGSWVNGEHHELMKKVESAPV